MKKHFFPWKLIVLLSIIGTIISMAFLIIPGMQGIDSIQNIGYFSLMVLLADILIFQKQGILFAFANYLKSFISNEEKELSKEKIRIVEKNFSYNSD